jgi:alpha-beta hydrolase superfamily lysophospholipase
MSGSEPFVTYLELRESTPEGDVGAGLSHTSGGLVLLHVLELAAHGVPRGAVTIVHDAGEHGGRYLELARALAAAGWSVALPDLRGHGRSEGEIGHSAGIREVLRDLGDVQDHLAYRQPEAPRALIGQGLGALYALAYACERPDGIAALVLSAPLLEPKFDVPQAGSGLLSRMLKKVGPTTPGRIGWKPEDLTGDAGEQTSRSRDDLVRDVITVRAASQAEEAARRYRAKIHELPMPALLLHGSNDRLARVEGVRAQPGSSLEVRALEGFRHDLFHESRAGEAIAAVTTWLDEKVPR